MTDLEKLEARLANTEKALFALATVIQDTQVPYVQDGIYNVMQDYFDANVSLGFGPRPDFIIASR